MAVRTGTSNEPNDGVQTSDPVTPNMKGMCSTYRSETTSKVALVLGACLVCTMAVFIRIIENRKKKPAAESIRQLTIWNMFFSGIAMMSIILFVQSKSMYACGSLVVLAIVTISLNVFVMTARAALLPFRNRSREMWSLDIVSHYAWPLVTVCMFVAVLIAQHGYGNTTFGLNVMKSAAFFLGILILWLCVNLVIYRYCGTWAYKTNAGHPRTMNERQWVGLFGLILFSFGISVVICFYSTRKES